MNIRQITESIFARVGAISTKLDGYIKSGIAALGTLRSWSNNLPAEVAIRALFPGLTEAEYTAIENAIVKAIKYLTQSDTILNAGTPDQMLHAFLTDLSADTEGMKETKLLGFMQTVIGELDGNSLLPAVYKWLVNKFIAKSAVGA